jgi:anionic cell wall polymer biosynthesis LytR-Cps2A-Psr (LCP) family protein
MPSAVIGSTRQGMRQRTLLLLIRDKDSMVTNAVLLATSDARHPASAVLIPPSLLVPTPSWTSLAETAASPDTLLSRNAVSMLLGVRVDASMILDRLALAAIVDAIGGVPAEVERPVTVVESGKVVVNVPAGARVLDGVTASDYAMALPAGRAEADRMTRFTSVLRAILRDLPQQQELRQLVLSLGSLAKSTQTNEQIVAILADLGRDSVAGDIGYRDLPVTAVRGDGVVQVDQSRARALILDSLSDAVLQPGESSGVRVVLATAGATPGQVALALARLESEGMTVIESGPAPIQLPTTAVMVQDASPVARAMGLDVASALGLPAAAVRIDGGVRPAPDVVVWLGRDAPTLASGSVPAV